VENEVMMENDNYAKTIESEEPTTTLTDTRYHYDYLRSLLQTAYCVRIVCPYLEIAGYRICAAFRPSHVSRSASMQQRNSRCKDFREISHI
jgi:hypothetical protein